MNNSVKYKPEELKKVQQVELDILKEIIRVCEENDITYFIYGGTTLGAVRHQGFIPWDDDIDLGMMRDDFNRFLEVAPHALKPGYVLQHYLLDKNTPTYHAKVRKDGTLFVEEYCKSIKMHKGIFVDVMPFDYIPDEGDEQIKFNNQVVRYRNLYTTKCTSFVTSERNKYKKAVKTVIKKITHAIFLPIPKSYFYNKLDRKMQSNNSKTTKTIGTRGLRTSVFKYADYFPLIPYEFENLIVMGPNNPDGILSVEYGDYMTLPPAEKRYTHAPVELKFER